MRLRLLAFMLMTIVGTGAFAAAPPIQLELATERGVQITAPQEWLQLLAGIGIENVRIRGAKSSDVPSIANRGTDQRPSFQVIGILTANNQLRLPGGTFARGDRAKMKDYFDRLSADGAESMTAPRGMFGLTGKEIEAVFADLSQPISIETKGKSPRAVIDQLQSGFASKVVIDPANDRALRDADAFPDDLKGITAGTGLAMLLRANGLVLRPEKSRGQPVVYHVAAKGPPTATTRKAPAVERAGKTDDSTLEYWPIGWQPHDTPGHTAPSLFEFLNAEIDGFTLAETLDAIRPRIKLPVFIDHASITEHKVDFTKTKVRIPKTRTSYKRVIDRALSQARLGSDIRTDESGNAFLWISR
jgi:hypothetical protein